MWFSKLVDVNYKLYMIGIWIYETRRIKKKNKKRWKKKKIW